MGFTLTPEERDELVRKDPRNGERIFPYLGGEEVNTSPTQSHHRYVISFGQMSLEEAERWPDLIAIVRERVKPERDRNNRETYRKYWWHFGEKRPALYDAIAPLERCLVTARVTKHLCFSMLPTKLIFNEKTIVIPISTFSAFAVLQSRVHIAWTWLLSSTLKTDLNYAPSDCFDNFPFPMVDPRQVVPTLEAAGRRLFEERLQFLSEARKGLTKAYNSLKDPECQDASIQRLRQLHEELDAAVLNAYGWPDIPVPPYCPKSEDERLVAQSFEDEVLDRLFALNGKRAEEEAALGQHTSKRTKSLLSSDNQRTTRGNSNKQLPLTE
jgi:hypothetical protein